ncbi:TRAP transporter small permease subunit [Enterovirga sp.]|uniref:TRAP transporter small permease subunit n=1 Tax=Enterovirga sp. TaxID=2026350 RepID=UPI002BB053DE|nr:TRAP transporter small permease subunit [Enterovirga sp.]HMO28715.1 TRAP transporter small permease subunit [Enterovirga sp.]
MAGLLRLSRGIDALTAFIGRTASWAILAAILVSAVNAIVRKAFGVSSNAWLELQWYLFGAVFMLCAPWTLAQNEHIRIDILSSRLPERARNIVEMFGHLVFLLPFALVMTYLSWPFFRSSFVSGEASSSPGGLLIWPAKALILAGFALLLLQWLSEVIKRIAVMRGLIEDEYAAAGHAAAAEAEVERLLADEPRHSPPSPPER